MTVIRKLVSIIAKKKMKEIEHVLSNPLQTAENKLMSIIGTQQSTLFGRKHDFEKISTPEEFSQRVPLADYDSMKPYLEETYRNPNGGILTADPVVWYVQTSGTSGQPKRLPITKAGMKDWSVGSTSTQMTFINADQENSRIFDGSIVMFGAPAQFDDLSGIPVGYMTGISPKLGANFIFRRMIKPGPDIFNLTDMDVKMREYAKLTSTMNVTVFAGITTLSLAFFRRMQSQYGPWLLDINKGTKYEDRIKSCIYEDGHLDIANLWPNLRQLIVTGIDTDPYREWISRTLPDTIMWEAYAGSEGYYGCQVYDEPGVCLLPHTNYFEFIPEDEVYEAEPTVIPLSDVKKGNRYEMVITNMGGWYRYRVGDLMTFTNTDPYTVRGIGRKGRVVNLTGEKVTDAQVSAAITEASKRTSAEIIDYAVVGVVEDGIPHYAIAAMLRNDHIDPIEFVYRFEDTLRKVNREFGFGRDMGALGPTTILRMVSPLSEEIVASAHIQAKPNPLSTDDSILAACEAY